MEDLQAIVATASVDDKDKEVTTARRNLVTDWVAKINNAKGVHKKALEPMKVLAQTEKTSYAILKKKN